MITLSRTTAMRRIFKVEIRLVYTLGIFNRESNFTLRIELNVSTTKRRVSLRLNLRDPFFWELS